LIYPNELETKDTTDCSKSALYLDVLLKLNANDKNLTTTQLYDKWDDFNFFIVNSPYLCSNIPASPAYGAYISCSRFGIQNLVPTYDQFLVRGSLLTNKLMSQRVQQSRLQAAFRKFYGRYSDLICPYNLLLDHILFDMLTVLDTLILSTVCTVYLIWK
jgi:hypothetical protein